MKKFNLLFVLIIIGGLTAFGQTNAMITAKKETKLPPSRVDFDAYDSLSGEVKEYRKNRLISLQQFHFFSKEKIQSYSIPDLPKCMIVNT